MASLTPEHTELAMAQFSDELLKEWVAPEIDVPINVELPDLSPEFDQAKHWFANYFLNSAFSGAFTGEMRLYATNLIYRIQTVFDAYGHAREKTLDYSNNWKSGAPGISRYLQAVSAWEVVFINLQTAYDLLAKCFGAVISGREDRARLIANRIKHGAEDIRENKIGAPAVPLWLTEKGFATIAARLDFDEMAGQIRLLAKFAECLSIPREAKARFSALDAELAGDPNYVLDP